MCFRITTVDKAANRNRKEISFQNRFRKIKFTAFNLEFKFNILAPKYYNHRLFLYISILFRTFCYKIEAGNFFQLEIMKRNLLRRPYTFLDRLYCLYANPIKFWSEKFFNHTIVATPLMSWFYWLMVNINCNVNKRFALDDKYSIQYYSQINQFIFLIFNHNTNSFFFFFFYSIQRTEKGCVV